MFNKQHKPTTPTCPSTRPGQEVVTQSSCRDLKHSAGDGAHERAALLNNSTASWGKTLITTVKRFGLNMLEKSELRRPTANIHCTWVRMKDQPVPQSPSLYRAEPRITLCSEIQSDWSEGAPCRGAPAASPSRDPSWKTEHSAASGREQPLDGARLQRAVRRIWEWSGRLKRGDREMLPNETYSKSANKQALHFR